MRAPSPTFKSHLADYRRRVDTFGAAERRFAAEVLDRWEERSDFEDIWRTLREKLPEVDMPAPRDFITIVLERGWVAQELADRIPQFPSLEDGIARHRKDGDYLLVAAASAAVDAFNDRANRMLGRKKRKAPRIRFMQGWSELFMGLCRQPLDEVVRVLTEIVFDGDATIQEVRDARRK